MKCVSLSSDLLPLNNAVVTCNNKIINKEKNKVKDMIRMDGDRFMMDICVG